MENSEITPLEILYQDDYVVAINKPSGLLVHKSPIDKQERRFALQELRNQIGAYVYPLHRLDKPTSGVLLFAFSKEVAQHLSEAFKSHQVKKSYLAIVRGFIPKEGIIDYPLKQMLDTRAQKQEGITKASQEAKTSYRCVAQVELPFAVSRYPVARYSLVKLSPHTGRKHQLRRHMKHLFHPIVGDTKHGRGEHNQLFREKFGSYRLLLHAYQLSFPHPMGGEDIVIDAPLDATMYGLVQQFGWEERIGELYALGVTETKKATSTS